jgi:hypothetical protein
MTRRAVVPKLVLTVATTALLAVTTSSAQWGEVAATGSQSSSHVVLFKSGVPTDRQMNQEEQKDGSRVCFHASLSRLLASTAVMGFE